MNKTNIEQLRTALGLMLTSENEYVNENIRHFEPADAYEISVEELQERFVTLSDDEITQAFVSIANEWFHKGFICNWCLSCCDLMFAVPFTSPLSMRRKVGV